jgi:hypothetical protein
MAYCRPNFNPMSEAFGRLPDMRFAFRLSRPVIVTVAAGTDAVVRRAKPSGQSSVYHGGPISSLARTCLLRPVPTRCRIEKPSREARLENDQFEWDRANLTIIKVS